MRSATRRQTSTTWSVSVHSGRCAPCSSSEPNGMMTVLEPRTPRSYSGIVTSSRIIVLPCAAPPRPYALLSRQTWMSRAISSSMASCVCSHWTTIVG